MKIIKQYIRTQIVIIIALIPLLTYAVTYFGDPPPPSLANHINLTSETDPENNSWLPDLTGLPTHYQVALLTRHVMDVIMTDTDPTCTPINLNLRMLIFQHFVIYQHMVNAKNIYFDDSIAHQWAHVLAMILRESSGDSTNITDMCGYSISTDDSKTNLQQWRQILTLSSKSHVELNYQTNFGLAQTSADRLTDAFHLTKEQKYDLTFLEGAEGAATPGKIALNTATAIRRLIWFYQGFAQGRVLESQQPLSQQDLNNPQYYEQYKTGLNMALLYCGTNFMFNEASQPINANETSALQNAMASIAYCKLGNQQTGYGENTVDEQCFAEWVTLCPALNIDIATLTPLSYFATRDATPVCEDAFRRLTNKEPYGAHEINNAFKNFWDGISKSLIHKH